MIGERFGNAPSATRKDDVAEAVRLEYRRRGYPLTKVSARVDVFHKPDRATLVLDVHARHAREDSRGEGHTGGRRPSGPPLRICRTSGRDRSTTRSVIGRELQEWENRMRSRGYYEARAIQNSSISGDGSVFVFLNLELGPQVRARVRRRSHSGRMNATSWCPVRTEASADEDLLEDSQSAIESYFRARGYRDAVAPYTRQERAGELIITFKVTRGPRTSSATITLSGNVRLPTPRTRSR
jgi:hypothetical protein